MREEKGVIFTFIGDMDVPPPLEWDLAPGFFDEDVAVCVADPYVVQANWRLGSEGGYDPGHHYIHNWSKFSISAKMPMTSAAWMRSTVKIEVRVRPKSVRSAAGLPRSPSPM